MIMIADNHLFNEVFQPVLCIYNNDVDPYEQPQAIIDPTSDPIAPNQQTDAIPDDITEEYTNDDAIDSSPTLEDTLIRYARGNSIGARLGRTVCGLNKPSAASILYTLLTLGALGGPAFHGDTAQLAVQPHHATYSLKADNSINSIPSITIEQDDNNGTVSDDSNTIDSFVAEAQDYDNAVATQADPVPYHHETPIVEPHDINTEEPVSFIDKVKSMFSFTKDIKNPASRGSYVDKLVKALGILIARRKQFATTTEERLL